MHSPRPQPIYSQMPSGAMYRTALQNWPALDARWWQIAALSTFIGYALVVLHAAISPWVAVLFLSSCPAGCPAARRPGRR